MTRLELLGLTSDEAFERLESLSSDVEIYREMVQILMRQLNTEVEQNKRLMFRLSRDRH